MAGWRLTTWPTDRSIAHLIFTDPDVRPDHDDLTGIIERAGRAGKHSIRTSAMFPRLTEPVLAFGFEPIDQLALLEHHLEPNDRPSQHSPANLRRWQLRRAAAIDRAAFGDEWANTPRTLAAIRTATPTARSRAVRLDRQIAGFAITGYASDVGYLQRLAVDPEHHRLGIAHALVLDALDWVRRRPGPLDHRKMLVNTGVDNVPALELYRQLGFDDTRAHLTVAELRLDR